MQLCENSFPSFFSSLKLWIDQNLANPPGSQILVLWSLPPLGAFFTVELTSCVGSSVEFYSFWPVFGRPLRFEETELSTLERAMYIYLRQCLVALGPEVEGSFCSIEGWLWPYHSCGSFACPRGLPHNILFSLLFLMLFFFLVVCLFVLRASLVLVPLIWELQPLTEHWFSLSLIWISLL